MTNSLKEALRESLTGWQTDLGFQWRQVLGDVDLAYEDVDQHLELRPWEPIFPSRRCCSLPGEPPGAHLLRAFDDLQPDRVRCVVIGQDPYPNIAFCTGRAFETGEHHHWSELSKMRSSSMRTLIQSLYAFRSGEPSFAKHTSGWAKTLRAIEGIGSGFPSPGQLAQHWVGQGVLLLNASLTISRFAERGDPHQVKGHLPLWRPFIVRLIRYFSEEAEQPVVFMSFSEAARQAAVASGIFKGREQGDAHPLVVARPHPAAGNDFLRCENPFHHCNVKLRALNAEPIQW